MQVPEASLYSQFVDRSVREVRLGLQLDNAHRGSRKRKVHDALVAREGVPRSPAQKVLEARFILGGDDASYLASGLACIWSTVGADNPTGEAELALAPASLYAPDAVNGIRQGLIRALERRNAEAQKEAPKALPMLMRVLGTVVDFVPDVPRETTELLRRGVVTSARQRAMLLVFLRNLKLIMADAGDSAEDPETNLARRILKGSRAGSRESLERIRRLQVEEDKNVRLQQQNDDMRKKYLRELEGAKNSYKAANVKMRKEVQEEFERRAESKLAVARYKAEQLAKELEEAKSSHKKALDQAATDYRNANETARRDLEAKFAKKAQDPLNKVRYLQGKIGQFEELLKACRARSANLEKMGDVEKAQCEARLAALEAEHAEAMVQEQNLHLQQVAQAEEDLRRQLEEEVASSNTLRQNLSGLEQELQRLRQALANHQAQTNAANANAAEAAARLADVQNKLDAAEATCAREQLQCEERLKRQKEAIEERTVALKTHEALEVQYGERLKDIAAREQELSKAKRELSLCLTQRDELKGVAKKLTSEIAKLNAEKVKAAALLAELQADLPQNAAEQQQLRNRLQIAESNAAAKEARLQEVNAEIVSKDAKIAELEASRVALQQNGKSLEAERNDALEEARDCEERFTAYVQQAEADKQAYAQQKLIEAANQCQLEYDVAMAAKDLELAEKENEIAKGDGEFGVV